MAAGEDVEAVRISGEGPRAHSALSVLENNAAVEKVSKTIEPEPEVIVEIEHQTQMASKFKKTQ